MQKLRRNQAVVILALDMPFKYTLKFLVFSVFPTADVHHAVVEVDSQLCDPATEAAQNLL